MKYVALKSRGKVRGERETLRRRSLACGVDALQGVYHPSYLSSPILYSPLYVHSFLSSILIHSFAAQVIKTLKHSRSLLLPRTNIMQVYLYALYLTTAYIFFSITPAYLILLHNLIIIQVLHCLYVLSQYYSQLAVELLYQECWIIP